MEEEKDDKACLSFLCKIFESLNPNQSLQSAISKNRLLERFIKFALPMITFKSINEVCDQLKIPSEYLVKPDYSNVCDFIFLIANYAGLQTFKKSNEFELKQIKLGTVMRDKRLPLSSLRITSTDDESSNNYEISSSSQISRSKEPEFSISRQNTHNYSASDVRMSPSYSTAPNIQIDELKPFFDLNQYKKKLDFGDLVMARSLSDSTDDSDGDEQEIQDLHTYNGKDTQFGDSELRRNSKSLIMPHQKGCAVVNAILCGGEKVGKTKLGLRLLTGEYVEEMNTLEKFDRLYERDSGDGVFRVRMQETLDKQLVREADVCLVCFSLQDRQSFEFCKTIVEELGKWGQPNFILVGCKADQRLAEIEIDEIMQLLQSNNSQYISCSSLMGIGILKIVETLENFAR